MKPNCLFSRLDRLNYQNGYYKVQMGLTEDILGSASLFLRRFDQLLEIFLSYMRTSTCGADCLRQLSVYVLDSARLTNPNFTSSLYGRTSDYILEPNCLSNVRSNCDIDSSDTYLPFDKGHDPHFHAVVTFGQKPWQTDPTFSYLMCEEQ